MRILLIVAFFCLAFSKNLSDIHEEVISTNCPFVTLYGLSSKCKDGNSDHFPMIIGIGYDSMTKQVMTPFLNMTYKNGKTIRTNDGHLYDVPDQLELKQINITTVNSSTFTSIDDYLKNNDFGPLGLPIDVVKKLLDQFELGVNNIIVTKQIDELFTASVTAFDIIPNVQEAIDYLPEIYDEQLYMEFISYWGTDIIISANGGAIIDHSAIVRSCFGGIDLTNQAVIMLMKSIYPTQYQHETIDGNFARFSKSDIINIYGGDPSIVKYDEWNKRESTIENFPIIMNPITMPIQKFIKNEKKKSNFDQAITKYQQNFKSAMTNIINDWSMSPKPIIGVPIQVGVSGSNWYNSPVTVGPTIASYTLKPTENIEICGIGQSCAILRLTTLWTICARDSNGLLYAKMDSSDMKIGYYQITQWEGAHVRQGCSFITGTHNADSNDPVQQTMQGMCCTGCIPSVQPPYNVDYRWGSMEWKMNDPSDGLFTCNCPPF